MSVPKGRAKSPVMKLPYFIGMAGGYAFDGNYSGIQAEAKSREQYQQ